jgi:O-antigen biosynthesis protein
MKILIISETYPMINYASGDLRFFNIIKSLSLSHDVVIAARKHALQIKEYGESHFSNAIEDLERLGVRYTDDPINQIKNNKFNVIYFEFYYTAKKYIPFVRVFQPSATIVVDTVDVHYRRFEQQASITNQKSDYFHAHKIKKIELKTYSKSDLVIAVTNEDSCFLKNEKVKSSVCVIPNIHVIPPHDISFKKTPYSLLFIGGFRHEPNVDGIIYFIKEIFPCIRNRLPRVHINIIGSHPPDSLKKLTGNGINVLGFVTDIETYLRKTMVSVAPLRFGAGMKGKVGEAMSYGLPVVSTTTGVEGFGLTHGVHALVEDNPDGFGKHVVNLLTNDSLYNEISINGRNFIKDNYSDISINKRINDIFKELPPNKTPYLKLFYYLPLIIQKQLSFSVNKYLLWRFNNLKRFLKQLY